MIIYLLKAAAVLAACLIFYRLQIKRETFYRINRFVLLGCLVMTFALPLIPAPDVFVFSQDNVVASPVDIPVVTAAPMATGASPETLALSVRKTPIPDLRILTSWIQPLYWAGFVIFTLNFIIQILVLLYRANRLPYVRQGRFKIISTNDDQAPCSFGNIIFINPEKYDGETYSQILVHEQEHVRQRHTIDILIAEFALVVLWFNPFAWLYRKDVENNLEFLTDASLLESKKVEPRSYQLSLLRVAAPHYPLRVTSNYNQSLLKSRVDNMNKKRSNVYTAWKYMFLVPVFLCLICFMNEPIAATPVKVSAPKPHQKRYAARTIAPGKPQPFKMRDADTGYTLNPENATISDSYNAISPPATPSEEQISGPDVPVEVAVNVPLSGSSLSDMGYTNLSEDELVSMHTLRITPAYVRSFENMGFQNIPIEDLISLRAQNITPATVEYFRNAGYQDIKLKDVIGAVSLHIDRDYIQGFEDAGYGVVPLKLLMPLKSLGISAAHAQEYRDAGYSSITLGDIITLVSLRITPKVIREFQALGLGTIPLNKLTSAKVQGITPDVINTLRKHGYDFDNIDSYIKTGRKNL